MARVVEEQKDDPRFKMYTETIKKLQRKYEVAEVTQRYKVLELKRSQKKHQKEMAKLKKEKAEHAETKAKYAKERETSASLRALVEELRS